MIDENKEELAALEALHLLEGAEKAQFDGESARDPDLRRRMEEMRVAAAALAHVAPPAEPPAGLKERILASAVGRRQAAAAVPGRARILPFPLLVAWAAAACFALAAAWSAQLYFKTREQTLLLNDQLKVTELERDQAKVEKEKNEVVNAHAVAELEQRTKQAQQQVAQLTDRMKTQGDLAQMKIAALASLLGNSPQALAVAVWDPSQQKGVLSFAKMPAAGEDKDYQLWVIPSGSGAAPVSAGTFRVDPANGEGRLIFHAARPVATVAKFAISLERKGGSPAPAGKIVFISP